MADYLQVIRRRRVFILLVAIGCAALAFGFSALQTKSYQATASITVRDLNQDLGVLGGGFINSQTPLQQASIHAPLVTRGSVVRRVQRELKTSRTLDALRGDVTVDVDPNSFLVRITATSANAKMAAAIANSFARQDAAVSTRQARKDYSVAAKRLSKKAKSVSKNPTTAALYLSQLTRLQSLSTVAQPIEFTQSARVPGAPSSPKPVRNTLAAFVFGLLLGILLAYARDALDRRLTKVTEIEEILPQPIVGYIRSQALGHAGSDRDAAAKGIGRLDAVDEESFRILRHNVRFLDPDADLATIVVTSAMAQEGKSTVAACLAMASAAAGKRTLLIECDLRRPVLAGRFGIGDRPGLAEYLAGSATPPEILQTVTTMSEATDGPGEELLVCITAGSPPARPVELLSSDRFRTLLDQVSEVYDTVILDTAPILTVADTLEIIPHVSCVLVCVRLQQTTRDQVAAAGEALARMPGRPAGVVVTDVRDTGEGYYGYYGVPAKPHAAAGAKA